MEYRSAASGQFGGSERYRSDLPALHDAARHPAELNSRLRASFQRLPAHAARSASARPLTSGWLAPPQTLWLMLDRNKLGRKGRDSVTLLEEICSLSVTAGA